MRQALFRRPRSEPRGHLSMHVALQWLYRDSGAFTEDTQHRFGALHFAYPFSIRISSHLVPFALRTAFPSPLVRRYSHDYYDTCVAIGLAPLRRSHVRPCHTC